MLSDDKVILLLAGLFLVILLVLAIGMFTLAENYPNNTALYLSVLGCLSSIVAIISFIVILADACNGSTDFPGIGFFVWYILAALSVDFAIAAGMVLTSEKMENNPYLIWNLIQ